MKRTYLGAVSRNDRAYGIVFLDFPGCVSAGNTLDDALTMGAEALQFHIDGMLDEGDSVPEPTEHELSDVLNWLEEDDDPSGDQWLGMYPIEILLVSRPASVTLTVDSDIVREIADLATKQAASLRGMDTLSTRDFIERAARREIDRVKKSA